MSHLLSTPCSLIVRVRVGGNWKVTYYMPECGFIHYRDGLASAASLMLLRLVYDGPAITNKSTEQQQQQGHEGEGPCLLRSSFFSLLFSFLFQICIYL